MQTTGGKDQPNQTTLPSFMTAEYVFEFRYSANDFPIYQCKL